MKVDYIKHNYHFETLSDEHDVSGFESDSEDLNNFLKNDALNQQKRKLNLTKLVICDGEIVGYVSLLADTISLKDIHEEYLIKDIKDQLHVTSRKSRVPAVKIGRFAVDKKYAGQGLGSHILMNVFFNVKCIAETDGGLRFVTVDGYAKALNFYIGHHCFKNLKKDDEKIRNDLDKIIERDPNHTFYLYFNLNILE